MHVFLSASLITAVIQLSGFAHAYAYQTEFLYDVCGGLNFIALGAFSAAGAMELDARKLAASSIFALSRGWLLSFLAWRARERGGDTRFDKIKGSFWSFLTAWIIQGLWVTLISLPVLFINSAPATPLAAGDVVLLAGFLGGVIVELIADVQKAQWVRAGRQGVFCTAGLWSYSRHPNYFGEMLQWWCAWLVGFRCSGGLLDVTWWATSLSPIFTMHILCNIPATGLMQANGKSLQRYYERSESYATYRSATSILLPMVGYRHVPLSLKRTIFLDLKKYEYRPRGGAGSAPSTRTRSATKKAE